MNTLEGNKLIAEFLGFKMINDLQISTPNGGGAFLSELQYHTSFDWLIPVVEKIENTRHDTALTGHHINIVGVTCEIKPAAGFHKDAFRKIVFGETKLEATYQAVLSFIEWHNTQQ